MKNINKMRPGQQAGSPITDTEILLSWLQTNREGKLTTWTTICKRHCLMRDLKGTLQSLVDAGSVRKLKTGYRANKNPQ